MAEGAVDLFLGELGVRTGENRGRLELGCLEQLAVADQVSDLEARHPRLAGAEKFAGAAELKIKFGDLETIRGTDHGVEAPFTVVGDLAAGHEYAIRLSGAAADAAAQLMELCQPEALGVFNHHDSGVGHVHADLDDRGGNQNIQLACLKQTHDLVFQPRLQAAVQQADAQVGKYLLAEFFVHLDRGFQLALFVFLDHRVDDVGLMAAGDLLAHKLPDLGRTVILDAASDDGDATGGHFIEDTGVEVTVKGEGQSAGNGGGGHD